MLSFVLLKNVSSNIIKTNIRAYGVDAMEVFNIISGVCSIVGLLVSLFTAGKVIKISKTYHCGNMDDHSKVINKGDGNTYHGSYVGRNQINGSGSTEQK